MNVLALAAIAAAWWYYRNRMPAGATPALPAPDDAPAAPITSAVFTLDGRTYRIVGEARADGLIPVQHQAPPGMFVAQVIQYYDPVTRTITNHAGLVG